MDIGAFGHDDSMARGRSGAVKRFGPARLQVKGIV
jgi:hypothetical protein